MRRRGESLRRLGLPPWLVGVVGGGFAVGLVAAAVVVVGVDTWERGSVDI